MDQVSSSSPNFRAYAATHVSTASACLRSPSDLVNSHRRSHACSRFSMVSMIYRSAPTRLAGLAKPAVAFGDALRPQPFRRTGFENDESWMMPWTPYDPRLSRLG